MSGRILVVDDERDLAVYLSEKLRDGGYEAEVAFDGVEGVLKLLDGEYDIILLDIRMPKLDGINALKIIRRITPQVQVLTFTGQAGQGDMVESVRLGAYSCLLKPIRMEELFKTLEIMMSKSKALPNTAEIKA